MTAAPLSRRAKAMALIPVATLSTAWTSLTLTAEASADHRPSAQVALPDGREMPSEPVDGAASPTRTGAISTAVSRAEVDQVVAGASTSAIPSPALSAYQRAAQIMGSADRTCRIPWELLAAVGRVESNHGQHGSNRLAASGVAAPGIFGPRLDGHRGTSRIDDTDAGELDGDRRFDRAVGPMQFLPTTWNAVKVDADGDGRRNPQDIDDSALSAGVYLCSGTENLSTRDGGYQALLRYNHSREYADLVLRIAEGYASGDYAAMPSSARAGQVFTPTAMPPKGPRDHGDDSKNPDHQSPNHEPHAPAPVAPAPTDANEPSAPPAPSPSPAPTPAPQSPIQQAVGTVTDAVCASPLGGLTSSLGACS